jgi:hypothetical protein
MWRAIAVTLVIGMLYLGWVFGRRWMENRRLEQQSQEQVQVPAEYRTNDLKILQFYSPQPQRICYGVLNAAKVRIAPAPGEVSPSLSRCVDVNVSRPTEFTLTAESQGGATASQTVVVKDR